MEITKDEQLIKLIRRGPKYRLSKEIDYDACINEIIKSLDEYIEKICQRLHKDIHLFDDWKNKIILSMIPKRLNNNQSMNESLSKLSLQKLKHLQNNFIFTVTDKASQNISIICKNIYFEQIKKELTALTTNNVPIYEKINIGYKTITSILKVQSARLGYEISTMNNKLPFIHIIPKFHKNPIKFRTIISSKYCATKPISSIVQICLKTIEHYRKQYCRKLENITGINTFWVIDNNSFIIKTMEKLNAKKHAKSIATYDFAKMYTMLEHQCIIEELKQIINYTLKDKFGLLICGKTTKLCEINSCDINRSKLMKLIEYVVTNTYFSLGDNIYKQSHGIPMGTDCAPQLANLYLHGVEYKYLIKTMHSNYALAKKLSMTGRYIDDLTNFNGGNIFDKVKTDIYPSSLDLIRVNDKNTNADVLDISITIKNGTFLSKLYDKRRDFNFEISCFPSPTGNIPQHMCYNVFKNQIIRYATICSNIEDFIANIKILTIYLITHREYSKRKLSFHLNQLCKNNLILSKYVNDGRLKHISKHTLHI